LLAYGQIALRFQDFGRAIIQFKKLYHILLKRKRESELQKVMTQLGNCYIKTKQYELGILVQKQILVFS